MARRNTIETFKLQLTVDATTDSVIRSMVDLGFHGANKAEVASWIIRNWIWDNLGQLKDNGISLQEKQ